MGYNLVKMFHGGQIGAFKKKKKQKQKKKKKNDANPFSKFKQLQ